MGLCVDKDRDVSPMVVEGAEDFVVYFERDGGAELSAFPKAQHTKFVEITLGVESSYFPFVEEEEVEVFVLNPFPLFPEKGCFGNAPVRLIIGIFCAGVAGAFKEDESVKAFVRERRMGPVEMGLPLRSYVYEVPLSERSWLRGLMV